MSSYPRHPRVASRLVAGTALALVLGLVSVVSLLALNPPPAQNGLGLLPSTVYLMARSGVLLSEPTGRPLITRDQAARVALRQGSQDSVQQAFLADVGSTGGGPLGSGVQLCWVVLLRASPDASGNLPAPGTIDLYMVLVNARSGRFEEGVIAFSGGPESGVGAE